MKAPATSALWAAVITTVSAVVPLTGARAPWLAILALPSFPGYALAFFFGLGSNIEGIPDPTNIAVHLLTFAVWWGLNGPRYLNVNGAGRFAPERRSYAPRQAVCGRGGTPPVVHSRGRPYRH